MTVDVVDRPLRRYAQQVALISFLRATVTTGKAIRLPIKHYRGLYGGTAKRLREDGYTLHRQKDGEFVIAWCERITT